jgi:hypothetical protein
MKRLAALLAIAVAFGAMFLTSAAGAREPTGIEKCQTISHPGSYKLVNDLTFTGGAGRCTGVAMGHCMSLRPSGR